MMMSKRLTMALMMEVRMVPMPSTMAIRQLPIVRNTASICGYEFS